jgi:hypothetical protein
MTLRIETAEPNRRADDLLDRVFRESVGGRFARAAGAAIAAAWTTSATRQLISPAVTGWHLLPTVARVRTIALAGATAMVVHLAMSRFAAAAEPLAAVVPALVIAACGGLALSARAVARMWERLYR